MGAEKNFTDVGNSSIVKRLAVLLFLGIALCVGIGLLTYSILHETQVETFEREYGALAAQIIRSAQSMLADSSLIAQSVAELYSTQFDADEWPFVAFPRFGQVITPFLMVLGNININHVPLLLPSQVADFEAFAYNFFENDPERFDGQGVSSIGQGIFAINSSTGEKFHDTTGETSFSEYDIITPIFQVGNAIKNNAVVMLNTHYERVRGTGIDRVLDCMNNGTAPESCTAITDFIYLVQDSQPSPAAIMYYPETPATNRSRVVGFVGVVFTWKQLLEETMPPAKFAEHISLVLTSFDNINEDHIVHTYEVDHDLKYRGGGDHSEPNLQKYRKTADVNTNRGMAPTSTMYRLSVVPKWRLYNQYVNSEPLLTSVFCSTVVLVLVGVLVFYDTFINTKAHNDSVAQEMRKVYVRWVSHEMRSPLNGAYLAIADLEVELKASLDNTLPFVQHSTPTQHSADTIDEFPAVTRERSNSDTVANLLSEVKLGVENSVAVLEDLLEYSCLDKPNAAEYSEMDVWGVVQMAVNTHRQSAKERGVSLELRKRHATIFRRTSTLGALRAVGAVDEDESLSAAESDSTFSRAVVNGDEFAILRALNSVLRSSLKISSEGETISITGTILFSGSVCFVVT
jgi:hypothetical protein